MGSISQDRSLSPLFFCAETIFFVPKGVPYACVFLFKMNELVQKKIVLVQKKRGDNDLSWEILPTHAPTPACSVEPAAGWDRR